MEKTSREALFSFLSHFSCPVNDVADIGDIGIDLFPIKKVVLARQV